MVTYTAAVSAPGAVPAGSTPSSSSSLDEGRFLPGTLLVGRYRVVALLGRGGMGEVYRANDLRLGQPVALKFLPEETAKNETTLARFYNEIRIARQVSHPNVCRVYDLGDVEGQPYLSMEYVDGEDLGSLLRRIGRLPEVKALEIARKLCAGLAAAHDRGVLHRDLKPSNIMLDGRGNVLITDFGLAGLAAQMHGAEVRNGTPAYMAPEQLAGKEVTIQSDIYALGLVLYEVFTGKRAFEAASLAELVRLHTETTPVSPTSLVKDLDPAVERVILRCLDPDPRNRPASALSIAAALPGGDPLAAALAAGETPSPQIVAASGETSGIPLRVAVPCLATIIAGLVIVLIVGAQTSGLEHLNAEKPPEVLAAGAQDLIVRFGYAAKPIDSASGFDYDGDFLRYLQQKEKPEHKWHEALSARPSVLRFWYRQSPRYLFASDFHDSLLTPGVVTADDPAPILSGMINVELDPQGRLTRFQAMPPEMEAKSGPPPAFDWKVLLSAAGLDPVKLQPADPNWQELAPFDTRAAWTGTWPGTERPLRVEAAAWRGRPVYFLLIGPWTRPARMQPYERTRGEKAAVVFFMGVTALAIFGALFFARKNYVTGRGDRRGAFRLAVFVFCALVALWLCRGHFFPDAGTFGLFIIASSTALFIAAVLWSLYLAVEPYVRKHWPHAIISWTRLSSGRLRDPLVARDILFGLVLGSIWSLTFELRHIAVAWLGGSPDLPSPEYLMGGRQALGAGLAHVPNSVQTTLIFFFLIFLLRVMLRRQWLAVAAFTLIFTVMKWLTSANPIAEVPVEFLVYGIAGIVVVRFGLIALAAGIFMVDMLGSTPVTTNFSVWYATSPLAALLLVLGIAIWSFHTALAGRPLFKQELFE
ncbi:MAG TPA: serine/threonine-protein kinase [Bryobacteraceae bacterium]|nr:serine/threonine-protein kinase [Bryobacteraceae bacterium]